MLTKLDSFEKRLRSESSEWHACPGMAAFLFLLPRRLADVEGS